MTPRTNFSQTVDLTRIEDLTRREFMFSALGAALLIACGDDEDEGASDPDGASHYPVTIDHVYGSTTISAEPTRIVAIGGHEQDYLLALGLQPVGLARWFGDYPYAVWPWARDRLTSEPEVQPRTTEPDFEWVASLQPDIIIFHNSLLTEEAYNQLSGIAPTVGPPITAEGPSWKQTTERLGLVLNRPEQAAAAIKTVEDKIAEVRDARPEFEGVKVAYLAIQLGDGEIEVRGTLEPRVQSLTQLGFEVPDEVRALTDGDLAKEISFEQLGAVDAADLLVVTSFFPEDAEAFVEMPVFQALKFAENGNYVIIKEPVLLGAITWSSVLSIPYMLDELAPLLVEGMDGNRVIF